MQDLKIPFGLDKNCGSIKEVGDVSRGRDCGCVCPSCRQGLIAKQGDVLVWHFSHDKDAVDRPVRECDISFESCCRLYAIDLALSGIITGLRTPAHSVRVHGIRRPVCDAKEIHDVEYLASNRYDLEARLPGGSIAIFLAYSSRCFPPMPEDPKQGLLAIDIEHVKGGYAVAQSGPGVLKAIIGEIFTLETPAKKWLYHPREQAVIAATPAPRERRYQSMPPMAKSQSSGRRLSYTVPSPPPNRVGQFHCLACGHVWDGMEHTDRRCAVCGSHLLSRFMPKSGGS
jgi:hypothetical protein